MKQEEKAQKFDWKVVGLAWRMGYTIALPLILLALGGRLLDKRFGSSPIFLLIGILGSIALSTLGIYRIAVPIINDLGKPTEHKNSSDHTNKDKA